MLFSLLKHNLDLYISDIALKVSQSLYCFTTSTCHGVKTVSPGCGVWVSLVLFVSILWLSVRYAAAERFSASTLSEENYTT